MLPINVFIVYRRQGMDKKVFQQRVANKGGLISFDGFLSTGKNRSVSSRFALGALTNEQLVGAYSLS